MCNEAARRTALGLMREDLSQLKIPLRFPEGLPNLGEAPSIRITDTTVIVRASRDGIVRAADARGDAEMVQRRWSWLGPGSGGRPGKPVYNYRAEGRRFEDTPTQGRCLIPLDGFYEFTDATAADPALALPLADDGERARPAPPKGAGKKGKKDKWRFTLSPDAGAAWNPAGRAAPGLFAVAGLWRADADLGKAGRGEAFTMLTCEPGPDIAPYHSRQIVLIARDRWADWLGIGGGGMVPAGELIAPTPAGTLVVAPAR